MDFYQTPGVEGTICRSVTEQVLVETFWVDGFAFEMAIDDAEKGVFAFIINGLVDDTRV